MPPDGESPRLPRSRILSRPTGRDGACASAETRPGIAAAFPGNLKQRVFAGLAWTLAQNAVARGVSLGSQLALALLLRPADFGVIGLTYSITGITTALINIGLDDIILQRRDRLRFWTGALFWISLLLASAAALAIVALSPIVAAIYDEPRMVGLMAVLALSIPIASLSTAPGMVLKRQLRFRALSLYNSLEILGQAALTIALALAGAGVWSLVIPAPLVVAVRAFAWWTMSGELKLTTRIRRWRFLLRNAVASSVTRLLIALIGQGDYLILGYLADRSVVGFYYFGFRLAVQPLWVLAGNFIGVLFPVYTHLSGDMEREKAATIKVAMMLSYVVMPAACLQSLVAGPAMAAIFGQEWAQSIPIVQILSIGLAFDTLSWVAETLLRARGLFRTTMWYFVGMTPIFLVMAAVGALLGEAVGVAIAVSLYYLLTQPVFVCAAFRKIGLTPRDVLPMYLKPALISFAAFGFGYMASRPLGNTILAAGLGSSLGILAYAALLKLLAPDAWLEFRNRILGHIWRPAPEPT